MQSVLNPIFSSGVGRHVILSEAKDLPCRFAPQNDTEGPSGL